MTGPTHSAPEPPPILVCADGHTTPALTGAGVTVVEHLCEDPYAALAAVRRAGADRVVLGLCERLPDARYRRILVEGGVHAFGVEAVVLSGHDGASRAALLAGAAARLALLPAEEPGRTGGGSGSVSRRAFLTLHRAPAVEPIAVVDPELCVGAGRCGLCAHVCPERAVDISGARPAVRAAACTACARCVRECPVGAIHISGASPAQIEAQLEALVPAFARITIACRLAGATVPAGSALIELPSLGIVTPGWLLGLRARGVEVTVVPCCGPCCAHIPATLAWAARIEPGPADHQSAGLVRLREPQATVEALARTRDGDLRLESDASPLGVLQVDTDACSLCGACAHSCPTEAIAFAEEGATASLTFDARSCTGCGLCVRDCPEDALSVRREIDVRRLRRGAVTVASAPLGACEDCGDLLPPRPVRRRVAERLGWTDDTVELCARCATQRARPGGAAAVSRRRGRTSGERARGNRR